MRFVYGRKPADEEDRGEAGPTKFSDINLLREIGLIFMCRTIPAFTTPKHGANS